MRQMDQRGVQRNTRTFNTLLAAFARAGEVELAMDTFWEMQAAKVPMDVVTFTTLIAACARGRRWQLAVSVFGEMLRCTQRCYLRVQVHRPTAEFETNGERRADE
jgi:pentatricopeptide repeat protein